MSVFPTKVLLATDGSEDAARATEAAVDLSNRSGSELHVVHVWHDVPSPYAHDFVRGELKRQGQEILEEEVKNIERSGGTVSKAHLREGRTSDEVIELSEEIGAGLIMVGSRGLGQVKRILLGSHSEDIVHRSHVPVLVLRRREDTWPPRAIVVGDDYSEDASRAAELAASIGELFGARAQLVHAYPPGLEDSPEMLQRASEDLQNRAGDLESVIGYRPEAEMVSSDAAMALLEAARSKGEATLVAVGSRGSGAGMRPRLGSISTKIVRAAPGPVLVCPHAGDA